MLYRVLSVQKEKRHLTGLELTLRVLEVGVNSWVK